MSDGHVFGSGELRPELLRAARFADHDGRYDPAEVHAFLESVASALEVLNAGDAEQSLRAEFRRNAEIAQQVLDAGQGASEQLRRQAAEDARRMLEETRQAASELRDAVTLEVDRARAVVDDARAQFIADLRDLYDRIGASLYRFERAAADVATGDTGGAARAASTDPVTVPVADHAPDPRPTPAAPMTLEPMLEPIPAAAPPSPAPPASEAPTYPSGGWLMDDLPADPPPAPATPPAAAAPMATSPGDGDAAPEAAAPDADERPPAWTQLPDDAYDTPDITLGPGEPLVDLRGLAGTGPEPSDDWLGAPAGADPAEPSAPAAPASDAQPAAGDSWLEDPSVAAAVAADPAAEDARAEALLAGLAEAAPAEAETLPTAGAYGPPDTVALDTAPPDHAPAAHAVDPWGAPATAPPLASAPTGMPGTLAEPMQAPAPPEPSGDAPAPPPAEPTTAAPPASHDALQIRQLILESLAAGAPRESIETYLRDQLGLVEPGALIDAALQAATEASPADGPAGGDAPPLPQPPAAG